MELVTFTGDSGYEDADGYWHPPEDELEIQCIVQPTNRREFQDVTVPQGEITELIVYAPAGTEIPQGARALVRGIEYDVITTSWDWSIGRFPANTLHKPKVEIMLKRIDA